MLPQLVAISARAESYIPAYSSLSRFAFVCMEGESVAALRAAGQSKLRASGHGVLSLFPSLPPYLSISRSLPHVLSFSLLVVPVGLRHVLRIAKSEHSRLYGVATRNRSR